MGEAVKVAVSVEVEHMVEVWETVPVKMEEGVLCGAVPVGEGVLEREEEKVYTVGRTDTEAE